MRFFNSFFLFLYLATLYCLIIMTAIYCSFVFNCLIVLTLVDCHLLFAFYYGARWLVFLKFFIYLFFDSFIKFVVLILFCTVKNDETVGDEPWRLFESPVHFHLLMLWGISCIQSVKKRTLIGNSYYLLCTDLSIFQLSRKTLIWLWLIIVCKYQK